MRIMAKPPETYTISRVSHKKCVVGNTVKEHDIDPGGGTLVAREFRHAVDTFYQCKVLHDRMEWLEEKGKCQK